MMQLKMELLSNENIEVISRTEIQCEVYFSSIISPFLSKLSSYILLNLENESRSPLSVCYISS